LSTNCCTVCQAASRCLCRVNFYCLLADIIILIVNITFLIFILLAESLGFSEFRAARIKITNPDCKPGSGLTVIPT
jgi:hypothetical protein